MSLAGGVEDWADNTTVLSGLSDQDLPPHHNHNAAFSSRNLLHYKPSLATQENWREK